ncbi:MAG: cytochrome c [Opitutus sp.]
MKRASLFPLLALWATSFAFATELKIELPPERTDLKTGLHSDVAAANCVTCHSWDYVTIQPLFPRAAWKATVTKMRVTFGAPLAENQIDDIVDYLAKTYGDEQPGLREKVDPPVAELRANADLPPKTK